MIVYLDAEFKCHTVHAPGRQEVKTDFFDDKCATFIEGYRFVPSGQFWTNEDGTTFYGEMITPWKPFNELTEAQRVYEQEQLEAMRKALAEADYVTDDLGNRYHREIREDGEYHLVLVESYTGELFQ